MSQTTKEINRITGTIIGVAGRLIIYALIVLLMYEGITRGYAFGHEVFDPTPVAAAPGVDKMVVIGEDTSVSDAAKILKKNGLIGDERIFLIQAKFYDYEIYPGTYTFNTSMTSKDMLQMLDEKPKEKEDGES